MLWKFIRKGIIYPRGKGSKKQLFVADTHTPHLKQTKNN